jgi:ethanolamine utilization protein EutM
MTENRKALGMIETKGLVGAVAATDAMSKAASVELLGRQQSGVGLVSIAVAGDVADVKVSVDAGAQAAERVGELVAMHVIARPEEETARLLQDGTSVGNDRPVTMADIMATPVRQLRRLARDFADFPIQGREISRANKRELVEHFRALLAARQPI